MIVPQILISTINISYKAWDYCLIIVGWAVQSLKYGNIQ